MPEQLTPSPADSPFTKPVLTWAEMWHGLLDMPESTARKLSSGPNAPRFFLIGRRRHILLDDALAWLETMAATHPYVPRKNRKGAGHD